MVFGGAKFFERAEVKDLLSYLRVLVNPRSDVDLERIVNVPPRKIGDSTVDKLLAFAARRGTSAYDSIEALCASTELGTGPKKALARFHVMMEELRDQVVSTRPPGPRELADQVLDASGYRDWLKQEGSAESEARLQNLDELVGSIAEFEIEAEAAGETATIEGYLERVTLATAGDDAGDQPKVSLMTVHAAKGLEFEHVFITGMEEEMFPFRGADREREDDDEERRLAYVAVTRARKKLVITHTQRRMIFGTTRYGIPSRFLRDVPRSVVRETATQLMASGGEMASGRFVDRPAWSTPGFASRQAERVGSTYAASSPSSGAHGAYGGGAPARPAPRPAPVVDRAPGERYVERDDDGGSPWSEGSGGGGGVFPGGRVAHKSFGVGVVRSVDGGPDPTATVRFTGWGDKRIKVRFLQPA